MIWLPPSWRKMASRRDRQHPTPDQVAQDISRPDAGKLIHVPDQQQMRGGADRLARADQHDHPPGAGDGRVEQVALEHHEVLGQHRHDHNRVLAALALVE